MFNIYPPKANKYLRRSATRVLASNFITDAKFACEVYVAKAGIEQFYNWTKNALEGRTFNVSTDKSLSGKNFILALSTSTISLVVVLFFAKLFVYGAGFFIAIKVSWINIITVFLGYFIIQATIYIDAYRNDRLEKTQNS